MDLMANRVRLDLKVQKVAVTIVRHQEQHQAIKPEIDYESKQQQQRQQQVNNISLLYYCISSTTMLFMIHFATNCRYHNYF